MQTDHAIGALLDTLDRLDLTSETLVFLTSDNGCSPLADFPALLAKGHDPSAGFRGHKADIYEGGHRVPFIVRWPGHIKPGRASGELICLTDVLATCADIVDAKLPDGAGVDSVSLLPAWLGRADKPLHEALVHHSVNGSFAIRQGRWKLALCPDSGGWSEPRPGRDDTKGLPPVQLFDLQTDIRERENVQGKHPEIVARLTRLLERYVTEGRSTPGPKQDNAVRIDIHAHARR